MNAFVGGELSLHEQAAFSDHLEVCPACRDAVESSRRVIAHLRAVPELELSRDLTSSILARAQAPGEVPRRISWRWIAAAAAVFAIFAAALSVREVWRRQPTESIAAAQPVTANQRALDWFVRTQEADGSWSAERWGGQRNYATALTALPLLALVSADETNPAQRNAAAKATVYLLAQQNADGTFGPNFPGSPYNSSISTLALLHARQRNPDIVPKAALDVAIAALAKQQTADGGWGHLYSPMAHRSMTQWHVQTLEFAASHGWTESRLALERGLEWLSQHARLEDDDEPATALHAPEDCAPDFYQSYFSAAALKHDNAPAAQKRLAALRQEVLRYQTTDGAEGGSWPPDDRWGRAGGRLYSTALASLSLASE